MADKGQNKDTNSLRTQDHRAHFDDFVLDKVIFSNIFEKDIRRVYIYKKAERLAKAIHLVAPAFRNSLELRYRMERIAVGLIDAAILPPTSAKDGLSRELLALSSVLSIARTSGLLSSMNAELIGREAHVLLQEVASYEEPRLFLDEAPTLAALAKDLITERVSAPRPQGGEVTSHAAAVSHTKTSETYKTERPIYKGQISDTKNDRKEAILSVLRAKGSSYIKDISTVIRDVSEKTIQRELQALIDEGSVKKEGERRWTTYSLAS
jgi:DNA-binding transcriptional ArsR family regulator